MDATPSPPISFRWVGAAVVGPLLAFVIQDAAWTYVQPFVWFFFFPAVFFSAWLGGLRGGLGATVLSVVIVIYAFLPPRWSFTVANPYSYFSIVFFVCMGSLLSLLHEHLQRSREETREALLALSGANLELQAANQKAREMDELKSQFFANVSHELRTPLTLILGPFQRVLEQTLSPEKERLILEVAERNARSMLRLVDNLLEVSRLSAGRADLCYSQVDLAERTRFVASHFDSSAQERGLRVEVKVPVSLPIQVDVDKFQRILTNLLGNAFKFTPRPGTVTVSLATDGEVAEVTVSDSGPGVPPELRPVIFEAFRQGRHQTGGGTGLGLAIVKELTELHGGRVEVGDAPGGGARFGVRLPLRAPAGVQIVPPQNRPLEALESSQAPPAGEELATEEQAGDSRAPLVLVVEDNADMRTFLTAAFSAHYRLVTAANGREGLGLARSLRPDLVVCDLMMPEMTGEEMLTALRQEPECGDVPVLILTANVDPAVRSRLIQKGARDFLCKPFSTEELLARADRIVLHDHLNRKRLEVDIAARKRAEQAFQETSQFNQQVIDSLDSGLIVYGPDLRVEAWNPYVGRLTGVTAPSALGKTPTELTPFHGDVGLKDRLAAALRGVTTPPFEFSLATPAGCRWVVERNAPLRNLQDEIVGVIATLQDISDQKHLEEQLRQSQKMEAVGRLAGGVAHDFNNLLTVILAYAELAKLEAPPDSSLPDQLEEILNAGQRAAGLTRQLLTFSRRQVVQCENLDLNSLVDGLSKMLGRLIGEDVEKHFLTYQSPVMVRADRGQLEQVLMNLCVNARDAMPRGGRLTVGLRCLSMSFETASELGLDPGDFVELSVSDTGVGMSQATQARIFEPFFTTKEVGRGTGLGLSTVYGIVQQAGGTITVDSQVGVGTVFRIYLPTVSGAPEDYVTSPATAAGRGETILVVDDEVAVGTAIRDLLTRAGYRIHLSADPGQALLIAEKCGSQVDLVLTDVVMPGLGGMEFSQRLRPLCPKARFLFMSGYPREKLSLHDHGVHYLPKPFDAQVLPLKVRQVLDGPVPAIS